MTRSWLNYIGGMILLVALAYALLPFMVGEPAMKQFCATIQPGDQIEGVIERASKAGYAAKVLDVDGITYVLVMDEDAMSRFICEITTKDEIAVNARYVLND